MRRAALGAALLVLTASVMSSSMAANAAESGKIAAVERSTSNGIDHNARLDASYFSPHPDEHRILVGDIGEWFLNYHTVIPTKTYGGVIDLTYEQAKGLRDVLDREIRILERNRR